MRSSSARTRDLGSPRWSPRFLAELETYALLQGGDFLDLDYERREAALPEGPRLLQPDPGGLGGRGRRRLHRFCAAATQMNPTSVTASGYRVMGHPGTAPEGYRDFSYGRPLSREATERGYLA